MLILVCGPLQEYLAPISSCSTTYSYCCSHTTTITTTTTSTANTISITTSSSSSSSNSLSAALRASSILELVPLAPQSPATHLTRNQQQGVTSPKGPQLAGDDFSPVTELGRLLVSLQVVGGLSHQILLRPTTLKRSVGPRPAPARP